jgi:FG-GAP repeat
LFFCLGIYGFAQSVGVGTNTPHSSAALEVNSTTKGTLITTMNTAQRNAIANPVAGLLVYDIDKKTIYMYDGGKWLPFLFSNADKNPATLVNPSGLLTDDFFGYKVAMDGNYAIIGAYGKTVSGNADAGAAYIYFRNNGVWELQEAITASDATAGDYFGASVSISGDYAVVGAWGDDIGADAEQGSIYVFVRSGSDWTQQIKISAPDGLANDFYGYSVDIANSGSAIIVGAYGDNIGVNTNQGSAYIYTRSGSVWTYQAKLTASDGDFGDSFGISVSISGQFAVVGSYLDDEGANIDQGSVYSFYELTDPSGWTTGQAFHQKLFAADGEASDFYGVSVSLSSINLLVGASGDDVGANASQGSAWSYFRTPIPPFNYSLPFHLFAQDGAANDNFGISVSGGSTFSAVGAYRDEGPEGIQNAGSVYVFSGGSTKIFRRKIDDDAADIDGYYGFSVAVSGFEIIIGAYNKNNGAGQIGFINVQ